MHFAVCLSVIFLVQAITHSLCIDGLPYNLVQMFSPLRTCTVTLTQVHTSKVKVILDMCRSEYTCLYPHYILHKCIEALAGDIAVVWTALFNTNTVFDLIL